jgi:hypothetical protein
VQQTVLSLGLIPFVCRGLQALAKGLRAVGENPREHNGLGYSRGLGGRDR